MICIPYVFSYVLLTFVQFEMFLNIYHIHDHLYNFFHVNPGSSYSERFSYNICDSVNLQQIFANVLNIYELENLTWLV